MIHFEYFQNKKRGFTLVELLVYMGILSLLVVGIFSIVMVMYSSQDQSMKEVRRDGELLYIQQFVSTIVRTRTIDSFNVSSTSLSLNNSGLHSLNLFEKDSTLVLARDGFKEVPVSQSHRIISNMIFKETYPFIYMNFLYDGKPVELLISEL